MVQLSNEGNDTDILNNNSSKEVICLGLEKNSTKDSGHSSGPDSITLSPNNKLGDVIKYTHTQKDNELSLVSKPSLSSLELYGNEDDTNNGTSASSYTRLYIQRKFFQYSFDTYYWRQLCSVHIYFALMMKLLIQYIKIFMGF